MSRRGVFVILAAVAIAVAVALFWSNDADEGLETLGAIANGGASQTSDLGAYAVHRENVTAIAATEAPPSRTGGLTGRVLTEDGRPIAGAEVVPMRIVRGDDAHRSDDANARAAFTPTRTDARGVFRFDLPEGSCARLDARADGFTSSDPWNDEPKDAASGPWEVFAGATRDVGVFVLSAEGRVIGRVVDDTGAPIAGAEVSWAESDRGERLAPTARTGSDGAFTLGGLPPREVVLDATAEGFLPLLPPSPRVRALPGTTVNGVDFVLQRGVELKGRLIERDGSPQADLSVDAILDVRVGDAPGGAVERIGLRETTSDRNGRFTLRVPHASGTLIVRAFGDGAEGSQRFDLAALPLEIVMTAGRQREVTIAVHDADTGGPLTPTRVRLSVGDNLREEFSPRDAMSPRVRSFTTLEPGRVRLWVLFGTGGDLVVEALGYRNGTAKLEVGDAATALEVKMRRGGLVTGRVVRAGSREPLSNVSLVTWKRGGENDAAAIDPRTPFLLGPRVAVGHGESGGDGFFTIPISSGGDLFLMASQRSAPTATLHLRHVDLDRPLAPVEIVLTHGGTVSGTLTRVDGTPLAAARLGFPAWDGVLVVEGASDASGSFCAGPLAAGKYRVMLTRPELPTFQPVVPLVEVNEGDEAHLDVSIASFGLGALSGRAAIDGVPFAHARIAFHNGPRATTDAAGRFDFPAVAPGRQRLSLFRDTDVIATRFVTIDAGRATTLVIETSTTAINGRVTAAETGASLAGAHVELLRPREGVLADERRPRAIAERTTHPDGSFRFESCEPGRYRFRASIKSDEIVARVHEEEIVLDATPRTIEVALAIAGKIHVEISAAPDDQRTFRLELRRADSAEAIDKIEVRGTMNIDIGNPVEPGAYVAILVDDKTGADLGEFGRVTVKSGETATLKFALPKAGN